MGGLDNRVTEPGHRPPFVLFDLDGTLSDSAPGILASLRYAFAANGLPPLTAEIERGILGPPFYESLPPLIGSAALDDVIRSYRDHYGREGMYATRPYPGVADLLAALTATGCQLAVATSKPEAYAEPIVEFLGLSSYFRTIGGDELDGSLGTKALVIGKVLHRLGQPEARDVLMVGDRVHDIVGAAEHGIGAIGAQWGYALPGELEAANPARLCRSTADVARALGLDWADAAAS